MIFFHFSFHFIPLPFPTIQRANLKFLHFTYQCDICVEMENVFEIKENVLSFLCAEHSKSSICIKIFPFAQSFEIIFTLIGLLLTKFFFSLLATMLYISCSHCYCYYCEKSWIFHQNIISLRRFIDLDTGISHHIGIEISRQRSPVALSSLFWDIITRTRNSILNLRFDNTQVHIKSLSPDRESLFLCGATI